MSPPTQRPLPRRFACLVDHAGAGALSRAPARLRHQSVTARPAACQVACWRGLDQRDALGLKSLGAGDDRDADALTGTERIDAAAAKRGHMHEDVLAAAVRSDKAEALAGLEPFHRALERLRRTRRRSAAAAARGRRGAGIVDVEHVDDQWSL